MSRKFKAITMGASWAMPMFAFAIAGNPSNVLLFMNTLTKIFNAIVPVMVALALIYFIYGLAEYILEGSGNVEKKEEGRTRMIYGTIAMFVIASIWGLVYFLQDTIGVERVNAPVEAPMVKPYFVQ